jgi:hypothetical protein
MPATKLDLSKLDYNKFTQTLSIMSECFGGDFPREIAVWSHYTQKTVTFRRSDLVVNDFQLTDLWCDYFPTIDLPKVNRLTVFHNVM